MERSIGMLIFHAICYSEEAARTPHLLPPSPLFSSVAQVSAPKAYWKLVWDHLSHIQASVAFHQLEMSLGSVGALVDAAIKCP